MGKGNTTWIPGVSPLPQRQTNISQTNPNWGASKVQWNAPTIRTRRKPSKTTVNRTQASDNPIVSKAVTLLGNAIGGNKGDSNNEGLTAIFDHKTRYGVTKPYTVVDKRHNTLTVYKGTTPVESHFVTLGSNIGDGLAERAPYLSATPRTTGAGVFVAIPKPTSNYTGKEPMFLLKNSGAYGTILAIHSPANYTDRLLPFKDRSVSNRVSFGCVSGNCGVSKHLYDDKIINNGDSVYVLPEVDGNRLVEQNGKLQMVWEGNNPTTYVDKDNATRNFKYNSEQ